MGAFGDVSCEYCGCRYYEQDTHYCDTQDLRRTIERLQRELADLATQLTKTHDALIAKDRAAIYAERERDEARAALRPFAEIEPSTLYCDDDHTAAYDPGYVLLLCEDYQRPDISREDLIKARAALGGEG